MMRKRILCLVLVLLLLLTGCKSASGGAADNTTAAQTTVPTTVVTEPPHEHSYTEGTLTEPDCTNPGYQEFVCQCGDSYKEEKEPALGHDEVSTVTPPTLESGGYITHTCQRCGHAYNDSFVSALPSGNTGNQGNQGGEGTGNEGTGSEGSGEGAGNEGTGEGTGEGSGEGTGEGESPEVQEPVNFFDDAAFVGDSVSKMLEFYHARYPHVFGKATFLCKESYSINNAVNNVMFLNYRGMSLPVQDALAACGAKKVFIMLGMNDVGLGNIDYTINGWGIVLQRIREKCPNIEIYIQSATPIYKSGQTGYLTNENMDKYNARLREFAAANGCFFIDIAPYLKDADNALAKQYTSDYYVHLTYSACDVWASILKAFVGE